MSIPSWTAAPCGVADTHGSHSLTAHVQSSKHSHCTVGDHRDRDVAIDREPHGESLKRGENLVGKSVGLGLREVAC